MLQVFSSQISKLQGQRAQNAENTKRPTCLVLLVHRQMLPRLGTSYEHWKVYSADSDGLLTRSCLVQCAHHCLPEHVTLRHCSKVCLSFEQLCVTGECRLGLEENSQLCLFLMTGKASFVVAAPNQPSNFCTQRTLTPAHISQCSQSLLSSPRWLFV